jgi:hypothetical protein
MKNNKNQILPSKVSLEELREREFSETLSDDSDHEDDWPVDKPLDFNKDPQTSYWPEYDESESDS